MKKICWLVAMLLVFGGACAEEIARGLISSVDTEKLTEFSDVLSVEESLDFLLKGDFPGGNQILSEIKEHISAPVKQACEAAAGAIVPIILLALLSSVLPGTAGGAHFICRLSLYGELLALMRLALSAADDCLSKTMAFSDVASPVLIGLLSAGGMSSTSALVSPAAALAGNVIERLFGEYGIPLCCVSVCFAIAGNLGGFIDLGRLTRLLKKGLNWCAGLCVSLFTALILLKGNAAAVSDGVAVRTAKYAVDSAASLIGSGVSDAWDTYLSGLSFARNSLGLSGVAALLSVCIQPMLQVLAVLVCLCILSVILSITGERAAANALDQLSGVCQMLLTLCGGAMSIWVILIGSLMSLGRGL